MFRGIHFGRGQAGLLAVLLLVGTTPVQAGGRLFRRARVAHAPAAVSQAPAYVPAARVVPYANANAPTTMLGTFYPDNYMTVRGNFPAGGGYSPLGAMGDQNLVEYGPLSSMRPIPAPVLTYVRGFDGRVYPTQGTAFSYPNLPTVAPVIYPTQATDVLGFPQSGTPPWWKNAINWIDQN